MRIEIPRFTRPTRPTGARVPTKTWPVLLLCLPAFVAIWGGWVGLGSMTGFGVINLLPGMVADGGWATVNTAVTLPIGLETYAAYALHAALNTTHKGQLRTFAAVSALIALLLGGSGQLAFHLLESFGVTHAPWPIVAIVATMPVAVLGAGTALAALIRRENAEITAPAVALDPAGRYEIAAETQTTADDVLMNMAHGEALQEDAERALAAQIDAIEIAPPGEPAERKARAPKTATTDAVTFLLDGLTVKEAAEKSGVGRSTVQRYGTVLRTLLDNPHAPIDAKQSGVLPALVDTIREHARAAAVR